MTPSFRQLEQLSCCIASVADQEGVLVEHIVQDGGTEGFMDFATKMAERWPDRPGYRRIMVSESDQGMYDAINRGLKKGRGGICAYLNCDEQYLPGALEKVKKALARHPQVEILYGGFLVVDPQGRLVTAQRPVRMFWQHVATSHLPNFTCATFFRRDLLNREQAWFPPQFRLVGDAAWTIARLRKGTKTSILPDFLGVFTETGKNLGLSSEGRMEAAQIFHSLPKAVGLAAPIWKVAHWLKKAISGSYFPARVAYDLHMPSADRTRSHFAATWVSPFWFSRVMAG